MIEPVVTKREDTLVLPSGRRVSPSVLTWAFKDLYGVQRSQIVQRGRRLLVRLQCESSVAAQFGPVLVERLRELTFGEVDIEVVRCETLDLSPAGKTRFVIREDEVARGGAS